MTTRTFIVLALGALGLSLAGCNSSGKSSTYTPKPEDKVTPITIVPGQEAELFPVKVGNTWVYEDTATQTTGQGTRNSTNEVTFRVTKVMDTADGNLAYIEVTSGGKVSDKMVWRIGSNGIYETSSLYRSNATDPGKDVKYEPPVPIVVFPPKPGSEINVTSTGVRPLAGVGPFKSKILIEGIQEVDSDMGRFSALCSTTTSTYQEKAIKFRSTSTAYWVPKVGIVRYFQEILLTNADNKTISSTSVLRLKSHQP